jgi:GR25 family glycosyltransferase involved in LPS biosynthesis
LLKENVVRVAHLFYNVAAKALPARYALPADPFKALNTFFDAIWVLTIGRNAARRAQIMSQFSAVGFDFYEGVDGGSLRDGDTRVDLEEARRLNRRSVAVNELACTLSHVVMFQEIVARGLERVLIFEDDAFLVKSAARWIPYCLERLPADWDLLYLGYGDGELRGFVREFQERFGRPRNEAEVVSRSVGRGLRTAAGHDFTHAYAVTLKGATKLTENAYPIRFTADGWLEHKVLERALTAYVTVPKIFIQKSDFGSSIHKTEHPA